LDIIECTNLIMVRFDDIMISRLYIGVSITFVVLVQYQILIQSNPDSYIWPIYEIV